MISIKTGKMTQHAQKGYKMKALAYLAVLLFSAIIHEISHGFVAYLRGDDTAKISGRITLNPIPHISLFGSIILPSVLLFLNSHLIFGWVKPVPVNYSKLKNTKVDIALISFAGPMSNLLLAAISGFALRFIRIFPIFELSGCLIFLYVMIIVNVILAIVNLMPIPPLDGSNIVAYFLPDETTKKYLNLNKYACLIMLLLILSSETFGKIMYMAINFCFVAFAGTSS